MRSKRKNRKAVKRLDLTALKEAVKDRREWVCLGIVLGSTEGPHYDLTDDDLLIDVEIMPSGEEVTCRVAFSTGGPGFGIWSIPPVGAEVVLAIPCGDNDFQPTVIATYSSNKMPEDIVPDRVVISCAPGAEVYIHDGSGAVDGLVKKSEYDALKSYLDGHSHTYISSTHPGPAASTSSPTGAPSSPTTAPIAPGTTVLKAK